MTNPNAPTQVERVERLLRQRGEQGVTPVDFLLPNIVDGGRPITRVAARVLDLRNQGLNITTSGTRNGVAVYVLRVPVKRSEQHPGQASIFDTLEAAA